MWQLFALGSLLFQAGEEAVDKIVMVGNMAIDTLVATFYRNLIFFLIALAVGITGLFGHITFLFTWPVALVGILSVGSAYFYTYLLKHIELTGSSALGYLRPAVFLFIDVLVLKTALSHSQLAGVLLLVLGSLLFVIDPLSRKLKPEYTKFVWLIFLYETISYIAEFYVFKYYASSQDLNEVSYMVSTYAIVVIGLFILVLWKSSWQKVKVTATSNRYLGKMTLSKGMDFIYTLLWYHALKLGTVSQVSALEAFYPLILLVLLFVLQGRFRFKTGERFDRVNLLQKTIGTLILVLGIWLTS